MPGVHEAWSAYLVSVHGYHEISLLWGFSLTSAYFAVGNYRVCAEYQYLTWHKPGCLNPGGWYRWQHLLEAHNYACCFGIFGYLENVGVEANNCSWRVSSSSE